MATLVALAGSLAAQPSSEPSATPAGSVSGTVVAAETGQPLVGAVAVLEAEGGAVLLARASGTFLARALTATTDDSGRYRFEELPAGTYRLMVRALGYHPTRVSVELPREAPFRLSVGLIVNPIRLEAITTQVADPAPYGRLRDAQEERRRGSLDAEAWRHDRYLEGDAAVVTHADVDEAVTLGETDLFRAMQKLPGVSARDDYTAGLWTRGAPWSQTRVYFDGLPLLNPVHAIGIFSGVNPDAVGVAAFLPGARSPSLGEGAAGVVEIQSRAPQPGLRSLGELSLVSAHGTTDWGSADGRFGLSLAARRSWADLATRLAEKLGADTGTWIPYAFYDLNGRFDADLGRGYALEASGLVEEDQVHGQVRQLLKATAGTWGNQLGRVTLLAPLAGLRARYTLGASRFGGGIQPLTTLGGAPATDIPVHGPTRNSIAVLSGSAEILPGADASDNRWSAGLQVSSFGQHYVGQFPRPYPVVVLPDTLLLQRGLTTLAAWGVRRVDVGGGLLVEAGVRVEAHAAVENAGPLDVAPKLAVRFSPAGLPFTLSAAAQRSWQYTQSLAPAGPSVGPDLYLTDVWLLAGDTIPALRADVATAGVEVPLGGTWVAAANGYLRHTTGMAVPEPGPGPLTASRPILVSAVNDAGGLELAVRRLAGRWTFSGSYTYGNSRLTARSAMFPVWYRYPSPADRRHVVDLSAMTRIGAVLRLGAAATWASGAPFSRFLIGQASCGAPACTGSDSSATYIESPDAVRGPSYASLDLLVDWSGHVGRVEIGAFAQVRNLLDRANAVTYAGSVEPCAAPRPPTLVPVGGGVCDRFDRGIPWLPLAGVRVAF